MKQTPSKEIIIAQIIVIFVLPVVLLYFNILPESWRFLFLCISSLFIYGIIRYERWTESDLGLHQHNFKKALPYYLLFTIVSLLALFLVDWHLNLSGIPPGKTILQKLMFFLPISFFQEFAFRAFLIPRLRMVFKDTFTIVFVNVLLFTLIHVIYPGLNVVLPLTFLAGIFLALLYIKYPNLLLVSLAHSATNIAAVLLGFFNIK